jgi:hypothetical protein
LLDEADSRLKSWVDSVAGESLVQVGDPGTEKGEAGVCLTLLDLIPEPPPRAARKVRLDVSLRYLVSAWAADTAVAHGLLGKVLFAALENPDFEIEKSPPSIEVWKAYGVRPRPAFTLRMPVHKELAERPVKLVRQPPVLQTGPAVSLNGRVTGPGKIPLMGALVELPGYNLSTKTDAGGRFRFALVSAEPTDHVLLVSAKGRQSSFRTAEHTANDGSIHILFQFEEG